jgi:glycosyltransferase involved in cell wall biosynthesis
VFVYASFIPLHGLEHVIGAAALLEARDVDVTIDVVGNGDTAKAVHRLAAELGVHSVHFLGHRPYAELPELMAQADVCLGIFGRSAKARRVIPNKVYDALACARPVITADTPAISELLRPGEEVFVCPPGDPEHLPDAIERIRGDDALRSSIAARGHARFRQTAGIEAISRDLVAIVGELR